METNPRIAAEIAISDVYKALNDARTALALAIAAVDAIDDEIEVTDFLGFPVKVRTDHGRDDLVAAGVLLDRTVFALPMPTAAYSA